MFARFLSLFPLNRPFAVLSLSVPLVLLALAAEVVFSGDILASYVDAPLVREAGLLAWQWLANVPHTAATILAAASRAVVQPYFWIGLLLATVTGMIVVRFLFEVRRPPVPGFELSPRQRTLFVLRGLVPVGFWWLVYLFIGALTVFKG